MGEAKKESSFGGNISIGTASLILIFIVLCLVTFGVLSLSSAGSEWRLSEKNLVAVKGYYEADCKAVDFQLAMEEAFAEAKKTSSENTFYENVSALAGDYYIAEDEAVETLIEMPYGQGLFVKLVPDWDENFGYRIGEWRVVEVTTYEVDRRMPVWTGEE